MNGSGWSAPALMVKPGDAGVDSAGGSHYAVRRPSAVSPAAAPRAPVERYCWGETVASGRAHHGEELGTVAVPLGDESEKGGENVWISRNAIDLA